MPSDATVAHSANRTPSSCTLRYRRGAGGVAIEDTKMHPNEAASSTGARLQCLPTAASLCLHSFHCGQSWRAAATCSPGVDDASGEVHSRSGRKRGRRCWCGGPLLGERGLRRYPGRKTKALRVISGDACVDASGGRNCIASGMYVWRQHAWVCRSSCPQRLLS